jgi:hypothetical protein
MSPVYISRRMKVSDFVGDQRGIVQPLLISLPYPPELPEVTYDLLKNIPSIISTVLHARIEGTHDTKHLYCLSIAL